MKTQGSKIRHLSAYLFWGLCTTGVNLLAFSLFRLLLEFPLFAANILAWIAAVAFAFVVNRLFVFKPDSKGIRAVGREAWRFLLSRLVSLAADVLLMEAAVTWAGYNELASKIAVNGFVIVLNYLLGRFFVFSGGKGESTDS